MTPNKCIWFLPFLTVVFSIVRNVGQCSPDLWNGYNGTTCGHCAAIVNVSDHGGSCSSFCSAQGLSCKNGWDNVEPEKCSRKTDELGWEHIWAEENIFVPNRTGTSETSDAICQCISPGIVLNN